MRSSVSPRSITLLMLFQEYMYTTETHTGGDFFAQLERSRCSSGVTLDQTFFPSYIFGNFQDRFPSWEKFQDEYGKKCYHFFLKQRSRRRREKFSLLFFLKQHFDISKISKINFQDQTWKSKNKKKVWFEWHTIRYIYVSGCTDYIWNLYNDLLHTHY